MTITLIKTPDVELLFLYKPVTKVDEYLIQHLMHDDYISISEMSLDRAKCIATAHGWALKIV